jgi:hypothetical protein
MNGGPRHTELLATRTSFSLLTRKICPHRRIQRCVPPEVLLPLLAVLVFLHGTVFSQNPRRPDTPVVTKDTLLVPPDTTIARADTLPRQSPSGIDSVVTYAAVDSVIYDLGARTMYLHGNSSIKYKELGLKASAIDINWTTSLLNARGMRDTSDTSGQQLKGLPDLIDGKDTYRED